MAHAFIEDIPATDDQYRRVRARLGDEAPEGMIAHLVLRREGGLRIIGVWESEPQFAKFEAEHVAPAVAAMLAEDGISAAPDDVHVEPVDVLDVWLGAHE